MKICVIKPVEIVFFDNVNVFLNISLTQYSIVQKINELAYNLKNQTKIKISSFGFFSIVCCKSTDVGGTAQLTMFFRACDVEFNIF